MAALRFLFVRTLHRHEFRQFLPDPEVRRKLPNILSREEVARLKIADIDSQRMVTHVVNGKGGKDRDLPLSPMLLETLRTHWRWHSARATNKGGCAINMTCPGSSFSECSLPGG